VSPAVLWLALIWQEIYLREDDKDIRYQRVMKDLKRTISCSHMNRLLAHPPSPSSVFSLSQSFCVSPLYLTDGNGWPRSQIMRPRENTRNVSGRVLTWCGGAWPLGMWVGVSSPDECEWACPDLVWGSVTTPSHLPPWPGCCLQTPWELLPCLTSWTEQILYNCRYLLYKWWFFISS
jgi:hypothetical protein